MSSETTKRTFPALNDSNWGQWADNMEAYLSTKELWEYVDGTNPRPVPQDANQLSPAEKKELLDWKRKSAKASGEIWLAIEDSQKVHVKEVKSDPAEMWRKLEGVHLQKKPGACFNAYDILFNIRKEESETLPSLMARADKAMQDIKALRPTTFTLDDLDKELLCMTLIRALPAEFNHFASSLLLLDALDLDKLKSAFHNEESQCLARNVSTSLALHTNNSSGCFFCGRQGHIEKDCNTKKKASAEAKGQSKAKGKGKGKQNAKEAQETDDKMEQSNAAAASVNIEFAGHASALSVSNRSQWLKSQASTDWNTDTGATSLMTPHQHWFCSYSPHKTPIRLADGTIIYSVRLGSVEFQPVIGGIPGHPVVFHDILHVPDLGSNLLSLFQLTRKGYKIILENDKVLFTNQGELHFTATVTANNVGYLDGHVIVC